MSVGNLSVTLTANVAEFMKNMGQASDVATASAERMVKENRQVAQSVAQVQAESRRFLASIKEEADTYGKSREEMLQYRAAQLGVTQQAQEYINRLKELKSANGNTGIKEAGKEMEELGFKTARSRTELLVLAHELSQGNYKRFGGSLMVLGEQTGIMSLAFTGAGLAAIGLTAAVGGVAAAMAKGYLEAKKFSETMQLTGGYAGITASQFDRMALTISGKTNQSIGMARESLMALAETGQFSGKQLELLGQSAVRMEKLTGQSAEDIAKDFAKMSDGVAKWAAEHNKSMHFITTAQYAHIQALEEEGKKTEALDIVSQALYSHLQEDASKLGTIERAWRSLGNTISSAIEGWKSIGRPDADQQRELNALMQRQDLIRKFSQGQGSVVERFAVGGKTADLSTDAFAKEYEENAKRIQAIIDETARKQEEVQKRAADAKTQQEGIAALDRINGKWREYGGSINLADKEIQKFRADLKATLEADPTNKDALDAKKNQAKIEEEIRKRYNRADTKVENAFENRLKSLGEERVKLEQEIEQWQKYGAAIDKSQVEVLKFDLEHDKMLSKLSDKKKAELLSDAAKNDALAEQLASMKAVKSIEDKIKAVNAEASAQGLAKEATLQAILMKELDSVKTRIGAAEYERLASSIKAATAALEAKKAADSIQIQERKTGDEIKRIKEESDLIGKSTLERQKLAAALKIEAEARKQIAEFPLEADLINASKERQIEEITAALQEAHDKAIDFDTGAKAAFKDYADSASNAAASAQKIFGDMFKGMEDALVKFVQTGKLDFKSMVDSILADLTRLSVRQNITEPLARWLGLNTSSGGGSTGNPFGLLGSLFGGFGGSSGGFVSSGFSNLGSGLTLESALADFVPKFDVGTNYVPRDMIAMVHQGERIVPAAQNDSSFGKSGDTYHLNFHFNGDNNNANELRQAGGAISRQVVQRLNSARRYT